MFVLTFGEFCINDLWCGWGPSNPCWFVSSKQEKQKAKIKEKLDKCVKEKLVDFCHFLNIPINKAVIKKVSILRCSIILCYLLFVGNVCLHYWIGFCLQEELSVKLLEFLECPHATTDVLLAEKEQVCSILLYLCLLQK